MGGLLHLVQQGGASAGCGPAQSPPRCTKCNTLPVNGQCTNHITVLLYDGPLLRGFNVAIKGLISAVRYHIRTATLTYSSDCRLKFCIQASANCDDFGGPKKSNFSGITSANPNQSKPNLANLQRPKTEKVREILGAIGSMGTCPTQPEFFFVRETSQRPIFTKFGYDT